MVVGLRNGLAVIKADSQQTVGIYQEEKLEIVSLQISQISDNMYMISTIDDMGECLINLVKCYRMTFFGGTLVS